jgi:NACHT domain
MAAIETLLLTTVMPKVFDKACEKLGELAMQTAWSGSSNWLGKISLGDGIHQQTLIAMQQYVKIYAERYGQLKVLGMRQAVPLEQIYTNVQFLGQDGLQLFESLDTLETNYRNARRRRFQWEKSSQQDGLAVANQQQFLMVLGQPGAGKSTFLRRMGWEALKVDAGKYQHPCIPVFIELKRFTPEICLERVIERELEICGFPRPADLSQQLLSQGKLLILLDGLDEVPAEHQDWAITQIQDFVDRYDQNRFIASCRTAAYRSSFQRFRDVMMADFADEQICQFISNWFQSKEDQRLGTAQTCWQLLQSGKYQAAKELAQTPLLLTLLCLVFDDSQIFPKNRAVLYGQALDVLLKTWAAEKRIQREPIYKDLSIPLEQMMLGEIAYTYFQDDRLFFAQRDVATQIHSFLASNLNAPKHLDATLVLREIQTQQGILVERAREVLSFSHLTFQEFLTAQHIADHQTISPLVTQHLLDPRWREVFQLVAGLMRVRADDLLQQMQQQITTQTCLNSPRLQHLLNWARHATPSSAPEFTPCLKSAIALMVTFDLTANDELGSLVNLCRHLALTLGGEATPELSWALSRDLDLARTLSRTQAAKLKATQRLDLIVNLALERATRLLSLKVLNSQLLQAFMTRLGALQSRLAADPQASEHYSKWVQQIPAMWFTSFGLDPDWLNLSALEWRSLSDYLYATELTVRCKDAAVRVRPQTWQAIERQILVPNACQSPGLAPPTQSA